MVLSAYTQTNTWLLYDNITDVNKWEETEELKDKIILKYNTEQWDFTINTLHYNYLEIILLLGLDLYYEINFLLWIFLLLIVLFF